MNEIDALKKDLAGCEEDYSRMFRAVRRIRSLSEPGMRTLDDFIRDIGWINDECRRVSEELD